MKAAIVHSFDKPLIIEDIPKPTAGPGEIVVQLETSDRADRTGGSGVGD